MRKGGARILCLAGTSVAWLLATVGCDESLTLPDANQPPEIQTFEATPATGAAPLDVQFAGSAVDPEGEALTYQLDFGDDSAAVSNPNASHTYTTPGQFTSVLTVTDPGGIVAVAATSITTGGLASFAGEVHPLFAQSGCATSSCHSASNSAGGLSLEGTAEEVHPAVFGLVDLATPCNSVFLKKPAREDCAGASVSHQGGLLWPVGSSAYTTVLTWIDEGALDN